MAARRPRLRDRLSAACTRDLVSSSTHPAPGKCESRLRWLSAEHLANPAQAVGVYRELLAEDARDAIAEAAIPELARLYGQLGSFGDLTDSAEKQAIRQLEANHQSLASDLWSRAAELAEKRLGSADPGHRSTTRRAPILGSQSALRRACAALPRSR